MDQHHYLATHFPEDLKALIKVKQDEVTALKSHQLELRVQKEKLKNQCDQLASQVQSTPALETQKVSTNLFNSMKEWKTVGVTLGVIVAKGYGKLLRSVRH